MSGFFPHSLFFDFPLIFSPQQMATRGHFAYHFDKSAYARIGVMPRHGTSAAQIKWFDVDPCFMFHVSNAYEERDADGNTTVVVFGCRFEDFNLTLRDIDTDYLAESQTYHEWRLPLGKWDGSAGGIGADAAAARTASSSSKGFPVALEREVLPFACDFPAIHPARVGRRHRFAWLPRMATTTGPAAPLMDRVVKYDHEGGRVVGEIAFGPGRYGGECVYVPRPRPGDAGGAWPPPPPPSGADEDDGWLITFIYDQHAKASEFVVFDARTMASEPVAVVALPQRVPYGFHGTWIPASERAKMEGVGAMRSRL